jgi:hypothetical protein
MRTLGSVSLSCARKISSAGWTIDWSWAADCCQRIFRWRSSSRAKAMFFRQRKMVPPIDAELRRDLLIAQPAQQKIDRSFLLLT